MFLHRRKTRTISLALQGGGAHGAFTWGVLDRLLEDGRLNFEGISGTSAGAMNAVVLAHGLLQGGRDGAREALTKFWTSIASRVPVDLVMPTMDGESLAATPALKLLLHWTRYFSPYQLNPFDLNPLRDVVTEQIDFERLRKRSALKLFIAATHANSGKLRLFHTRELTADMLLASACLPTMHHAIEIDGESYWDGGYAANPAVFPLFYECTARDIVLVLLSPFEHERTPRTAEEIHNRALDLAFSANFLREMRMIDHAREYVARSWPPLGRLERRLMRTNFHLIEADELMGQLGTETKLAAHLPFLERLRDKGRERAKKWLVAHRKRVGASSSFDLAAVFR